MIALWSCFSIHQGDIHSYMKELIWYDDCLQRALIHIWMNIYGCRDLIFNPPEKKQLLFIWPLLLKEGSSFMYDRMYMIALWQGVNFFIWSLCLRQMLFIWILCMHMLSISILCMNYSYVNMIYSYLFLWLQA